MLLCNKVAQATTSVKRCKPSFIFTFLWLKNIGFIIYFSGGRSLRPRNFFVVKNWQNLIKFWKKNFATLDKFFIFFSDPPSWTDHTSHPPPSTLHPPLSTLHSPPSPPSTLHLHPPPSTLLFFRTERYSPPPIPLKSLFKVLFFCQAFVHKALRPKISTNFDDIDTLEVSKIIFVNFCIHFWNFFWVCLFPRNFWPIKEWRKIKKIVKNRLFHQNSQKSTNVDFFFKNSITVLWFYS